MNETGYEHDRELVMHRFKVMFGFCKFLTRSLNRRSKEGPELCNVSWLATSTDPVLSLFAIIVRRLPT